jgi:hypothetical protein
LVKLLSLPTLIAQNALKQRGSGSDGNCFFAVTAVTLAYTFINMKKTKKQRLLRFFSLKSVLTFLLITFSLYLCPENKMKMRLD